MPIGSRRAGHPAIAGRVGARVRSVSGSLSVAVAIAFAPACRKVEDAPPIIRDGAPAPAATPEDPPPAASGTTIVVPDFARVAERLSPSVVTVISTVAEKSAADGERAKTIKGLGSGMIVSARAQVLTNEHVVVGATRVEVELSTHERLAARVLHADPMLDLALLEIVEPTAELVPVELSEQDPRPGQFVMAVGQPFGLGHTVTVGVVSGLGRDYVDVGRPPGLDPEGIWSFIQTDASINIGNSGGPLVDADGKVVGITTAVRADGQGLAFAIPSAMARRFLDEVWTHGRVRHTRLGIKADNAAAGELPGRGSVVRVTDVDPSGPGAKAELQPGDFILAIDETPVDRVSDVAYLTQLRGVGARLLFTIRRGEAPPEQVLVIPAAG
jgi:S1-C subfamily serine protease